MMVQPRYSQKPFFENTLGTTLYWAFIGLMNCFLVWVQGPMLVQGGANAVMIPERIQGGTIPYD